MRVIALSFSVILGLSFAGHAVAAPSAGEKEDPGYGSGTGTTSTSNTSTGGIAAVSYIKQTVSALKTTVDADLATREAVSNKTTTISSSSTDSQYPSAHAVYSAVSGRVATDSSAVQNMAGTYTVSGTIQVPDQDVPTE